MLSRSGALVLIASATLLGVSAPARAQALLPGIQRFGVDPAASTASFDGTSTLHNFTGTTKAVSGEVRFDPAFPDTTAGGSVSIDAATLDTDNKDRDAEMRKKLETDRFARITFTLDALKTVPANPGAPATVSGHFSIRGVDRVRTFAAALTPGRDGAFRIKGELKFKLTDHGIDPPGVLFVTMGDEIRVAFDVGFRPVDAARAAAQVREMVVVERSEPIGAPATETSRTERLWIADERLIWERAGSPVFVLAHRDAVSRLDVRHATTHAAAKPCEPDFQLAGASLAGLTAKIAALPPDRRAALTVTLQGTLTRLAGAAALAPATGPADVTAANGVVTVRLGGIAWATFDALSGQAPFPAMLTGIEGIPAAVRTALAGMRGVPASFTVRTATPAGVRSISYTLKPAVDGAVPNWLADPAAWTTASDREITW